jgi:hypothetical protein
MTHQEESAVLEAVTAILIEHGRVRYGGAVVPCAVLTAIGVTPDGKRSVLGCSVARSEAETHWREFLESLQARGMHGVKLVVSDDHSGLKAARHATMPGVPWQRCQFHTIQNALADAGTTAGPRAPRKPRAERATLSGMAPEDFAETLLKGPDFAQTGPIRPNASQRSQVVDGHGHCVRNRRKSETFAKGPERIPPSPPGLPFYATSRAFPAATDRRLARGVGGCSR